MSELKTVPTEESVEKFLESIENAQRREDASLLVELFVRISGEPPVLWGSALIGFGKYHYKSERSKQEGDWPLAAFSPRKANTTVYVMSGVDKHADKIALLGKCKTSVSCIYINKLSDIDLGVLETIIKESLIFPTTD